MVKHTQAIRRLMATNCLSVIDHFVGLAPKGLKTSIIKVEKTVEETFVVKRLITQSSTLIQ